MRREARVFRDALLWVVLCLPVLWAGLTSSLADGYTRWEVTSGLVLIGVAVALGRSRPLPAMLVTAVLWVASVVSRGDPTVFFPALAAMSYLAGVRMVRARPALAGLSGATVTAAVLVPLLRWDLGAWFFAVTGILLFGVVPWLAGRARHQYLALARAGWERAEQLEREQRIIAEQVRLRERARIAGDMHDLLGHELSLIALRIGGLEVAPDLGEHHREAAGEARAAITAASERLRDIVEVLHDGSSPEPAWESVAELVRRAGLAGMPVELHEGGQAVRLPPMVERAARRVVQEGLTNAAKHAEGAPVTVRLDHLAGETVVTVSNGVPPAEPLTGSPAGSPAGSLPGRTAGEDRGPVVGGGHGLAGLAERVRLCGGFLRSGPRNGGFELTARLPHAAGPVPAPPGPSRSAVHLAEARQRARRTRATAIAVALAAVAGVVAFVLGFMTYDAVTSVLRPADFDRLRTGQAQVEVEALLPARTRIDDPSWPEPPAPAGVECRYYGTHRNPFDERRHELYRLCFAGGRLASKDFLPAP
ncbi:sensor histidine kinase [Streptosporangium sp. NPDC000396]|uniref:sensor histidine kinase n=1 Tax=Streptosporangium sp. NPDC000396 TaxID=3366185 RepID=UPI003679D0DB